MGAPWPKRTGSIASSSSGSVAVYGAVDHELDETGSLRPFSEYDLPYGLGSASDWDATS